MDPIQEYQTMMTRRALFGRSAAGLGTAALASMLPQRLLGGDATTGPSVKADGLPGLPHFAPKAKRVIYLFMSGAPSQLDMFDHKPGLADKYDQDLPAEVVMGQRFTTMTSGQKRFPVAPSKYQFAQYGGHGQGAWVSELLPHTTKIVDDVTFIRSMHTEAINHDPAITYIQTGNQLPGRPSLGAWISYGLGTLNKDLPSFIVMQATWSAERDAQALYERLWGSGFLASKYQGVSLRSSGDPVLYLTNPDGVDRDTRRHMLDGLAALNQQNYQRLGDPEIQDRIAQYEMAFRMQASVPGLIDISDETQETLDIYGPDVTKPGTFAASCLLARRMAERDVRCIQIFHRGWDQHGNIAGDLPAQCKDVDQASYALITDLKRRGMLDDTLVIWGGEFGRTVYCQGALSKQNYGRDHHPRCFTIWMAGAGVKRGHLIGTTDDYGYNILEDPYHIRDLNATILHQLGINHEKLTYKYQGLDQRLTGVEEAHVIKQALA